MFSYIFNIEGKALFARVNRKGAEEKWGAMKAKDIITLSEGYATASFSYYSPNHVESKEDLLVAIECFCYDAIAYESAKDILDFAEEFGYKDNKECREAYKGCKKASEDFEKLSINPFDLLAEVQQRQEQD